MRPAAVAFAAILVLAPALDEAPAAGAHPSGCTEALMGFFRSCDTLPNGQRGVYYDTPVLFVMFGSGERGTDAGAGSLAGATAHSGSGRVAAVVYANTIIAWDRAIVRAEPSPQLVPGSAGAWGVTLTLVEEHDGMPGERDTEVGRTFVGDGDADGTPEARVWLLGEEVRLLP